MPLTLGNVSLELVFGGGSSRHHGDVVLSIVSLLNFYPNFIY